MKWNPIGYFEKSAMYLKRAYRADVDKSERAFWSSLALEQLCRAAICGISPVLNADPQDEGASILFALGFEGKKAPKTLPMHAVIARLEQTIEGFTLDSRKFCEGFMYKRNEEVHDSVLAFEDLAESAWLVQYYGVCKVLLEGLGKSLEDLLGRDVAKTAEKLLAEHKEDLKGEVKEQIKNHKAVFDKKDPDEKLQLAKKRPKLRLDADNSTVDIACPACQSMGRLVGVLASESQPFMREQSLLVKRTYQSSMFACGACGLKLSGVAALAAAKFDPTFTEEVEVDPHELFPMDFEEDYHNM